MSCHLLPFHLAPTPPAIIQFTIIDSRSVYVQWNRPVKPYGILSFYTITYVTENITINYLMTPYNGLEVSILNVSEIHNF